MKKIIFFLVLLPFLSGCEKQGPCKVVTGIHVTSGQKQCFYDSPRKLEKFLYYLRGLDTWGPAELDALEGDEVRIDLTFSDGSGKVYRQRGFGCLSVNGGGWLKIRSDYAEKLPLLLEAIPPDG